MIGALDTGRTVRSLAYLLSKFERTKLYFLAPPEMQVRHDILNHLDENSVAYEIASDPSTVLPQVDVVYQTRIDRERLHKSDVDLSQYNIDAKTLARMKPNAIIMHPLPRSVEIDASVDQDPRSAYFRQSRNGLFVRMALLTLLFDYP
jgi:aspartate carbamoyltransferase catalytic subunit